MESMGPCGAGLMEMFEARVIPVCGDLGAAKAGPDAGRVGFPRE